MCGLIMDLHAACADRIEMLKLLGEGCCVGTAPEGLAGAFKCSRKDEEYVCLSRHKGYIRVALEAGSGDNLLSACTISV